MAPGLHAHGGPWIIRCRIHTVEHPKKSACRLRRGSPGTPPGTARCHPRPVIGRQGLCWLSLSQVVGSPDAQAPGMTAALGPLLSLCGYLSPTATLILPQQEKETLPQNKTVHSESGHHHQNACALCAPRPGTPGCRQPPPPCPCLVWYRRVPRPVTSYLPSPPQWPGLASSCLFPCSWTKALRTGLDVGSAAREVGQPSGGTHFPGPGHVPLGGEG